MGMLRSQVRELGRGLCRAVGLLGAWLLMTASAQASVAVLLEQPYGGMGKYNPTGHSALYFDHICAASPIALRPCAPGELGVVISRYDEIGSYDWVAMPLVPYLFAVDSPAAVPARIDRLEVLRLRDLYRRKYLEELAPDTPTGGMPQGNWYELVGSAYNRTIYGFQLQTSPAQDAALIARLNDNPNVTRYNGAFRNCADFTRDVLNQLYPHAVRRNFIADFGLMTPKDVARDIAHYGRKHPELEPQTFVVPQVPGDLPRSVGVEGVTESLLKRYAVPMLALSPHVTAAVLAAYVGDGRFGVPKHAPTLDLLALEQTANPVPRTRQLERRPHAEEAPTKPENEGESPSAVVLPFHPGSRRPQVGEVLPSAYVDQIECDLCGKDWMLP